jgi:hypothetical protein
MKKERIKRKGKGKIENEKKNRKNKGYFGHFTLLSTRRSCFA